MAPGDFNGAVTMVTDMTPVGRAELVGGQGPLAIAGQRLLVVMWHSCMMAGLDGC